MKYVIILIILIYNSSIAQSNYSYAKSSVPTKSSNTRQTLQLLNDRENLYYKNRNYSNEIEEYIISSLRSLKIDSINTTYREGLKRNIKLIEKLRAEGLYADYYLSLTAIEDDLIKNELYYEDEEEYRNDIIKEKRSKEAEAERASEAQEKLTRQAEEIKNLKMELENQKKLQTKQPISRKNK